MKTRTRGAAVRRVNERLARHGGLSYLEIPAVQLPLGSLLRESFRWTLHQYETDAPRFTDSTGHLIGRWVTGRLISRDSGLLPYIYVDHIDDTVERVTAKGGEVLTSPYAEGNLRVATVRDPAGNVIGLWQEKEVEKDSHRGS